MARILACIDGSSYANSVCDHAGWFASDPDIGVEVLHVSSPTTGASSAQHKLREDEWSSADTLIDHAVLRLQEDGVGPITSAHLVGSFVELASQRGSEIIVMGKRGEASEAERRRLGSSVDAMVRATATPICLTSKVFLPVHRGLVLLDADMSHRSAIDFVTTEPRLADLPVDVVVVCQADENPDPKTQWAREALKLVTASVFALPAEGLDETVTKYMESRSADLLILSRAVVSPDPEARLRRIEERGLWGARTPVLIC